MIPSLPLARLGAAADVTNATGCPFRKSHPAWESHCRVESPHDRGRCSRVSSNQIKGSDSRNDPCTSPRHNHRRQLSQLCGPDAAGSLMSYGPPTARVLGIDVRATLSARAGEVIE